jgi:hypothetical protein
MTMKRHPPHRHSLDRAPARPFAPLEYVTAIVQREPAVVIARAAAANPLRTGLVTLTDTECAGAAVLGAGVEGGLAVVTVGGRVAVGAAVGARVAGSAVAGIADVSALGNGTGGEVNRSTPRLTRVLRSATPMASPMSVSPGRWWFGLSPFAAGGAERILAMASAR